jgi:hypothetical protein
MIGIVVYIFIALSFAVLAVYSTIWYLQTIVVRRND